MAKKRKATSSQKHEQKPKISRKVVEEVEEEEEETSDEEEEEQPEEDSSSSEQQSESENEEEEESSSSEDEPNDEASKRETLRELLEPYEKSQIINLLKEASAKDPKLISKIVEVVDSDPTHRKIFVHGLSWDATSEQLVQAFKPFGDF